MKIPLLSDLLRSGRLMHFLKVYQRVGLLLEKSRLYSKFLVLFAILFFSSFCVFAQFPYDESFKNASAANVVFGGAPSAYLTAGPAPSNAADPKSDPIGSGYLRLTNKEGNQKGYVYSNNVFLGTYGLNIEFEYFTYGGNGADGICFFLFDASVTDQNFNIGGFGGSLGYSQISSNVPGVSKGYLGIGIDEYGNFSDSGEDRQLGPGRTPNSVTLRGAGNGFATDGQNYKHLSTTQTYNNGNGYEIAGGLRGATPADPQYRKAIINLVPRTGGGLVINVSIQHGSIITPVITGYQYTQAVPSSGLKYGISSSTGGSNNYHEIRGLTLKVDPSKLATPQASNDTQTICQGNSTEIDILSNDTKPNADGAINLASIDLDPSTTAIEQTITINNVGTFTFSQATGKLNFAPLATFTSTSSALRYTYMDVYGAKSTVGQVTVNVVTPKITTQPQSAIICEGKTFTTSATVNGAGATFQWYYQVPNGSWQQVVEGNGVSVTNTAVTTTSTRSSLSIQNVPASANGNLYRLDVTSSAQACVVSSTIASLGVNPLPTATINGTTEVCASSANSTITFQGNGGTAPYTFSYKIGSGATLTVVSNGAGLATVSQSNATAGSYVYTLLSVSDASNTACSNAQTGSATVKVNPLPTATINGTTEVCAGSANSTITFQGNGGTAPYTFSYKIGTGAALTVVSNGAGLATVSQSNATAGSYVYTLLSVSDASNTACSNAQTGTATVKVNPLPTATINGTTEVCVSSANSTITFQGNGGVAPYTFSYQIGTGATLTVVSNGAGLATVSQSNATAGSYVYTLLSVSDASNTACSNPQTGSATVKVNPLPTATINGTTEVCASSANSTITFQGNGGTAPYTFSYKIGTGAALTVVSNGAGLATVNQSNATAGSYVYTLLSVSDATNTACSNAQTGTATVKVNPLPTATINGTTEVCASSANSTITFQGNGGTAPYTFSYKIGTGAALTVVSNGAGLATVSQSNATAGSYVYTLLSVSDASNTACSNAQTGTATVKVNPLPTATINGTTEVCASSANSTITFQGNGGTAPYTFSYKMGTGATLTVVSNGAGLATVSQSNATAGSYVYTLLSVSDASNTACSNAQTGSATVKVNPLPTATINGTTEVCAGSANSTITFQGNGGTGPYTFSYKIGNGAALTVVSNGAGLATVDQSNATAGNYVYTLLSVSDASNTACSNPQSGTATVKVNPLPTATINGTTEVCAGSANSTITFQGNGGTAPYTFSYKIGTGATLTVVSNGAGLATVSQSNATAGSYVYTLLSVSDASNTACSNPQTGSATVKVNPLPTATINGTTEVCTSSANSTITFQGNGGTAPYTFSYKTGTGATLTVVSNGAGLATVSQSNATAGSYVYTLLSVSDASNTACSNAQTGSATVKVNPLPTATINGTTEVCASSANSTITFQGNGGTAPYTFSYQIGTGATLTVVSNGAGLANVSQSNATAGSYVYTLLSVSDASNTACSNAQTGSATVKVNPLPTATINGTTEVCASSANSTITFQGNGGTAPYTFSYKIGTGATLTVVSNGAGLATVSQSNAIAGSYVYTLLSVSDATNTACSNPQTGTATVKVNPLPTATINGTTEVCAGSANSTITFQGDGGTAPYTFSYKIGTGATLTVVSNGAGLATVGQSNATAGSYVYTLLSVADASNTACSNPQSGTATVKVNPLPTATINGTTEVCASSANSTITFQGNGGIAPYTFSYKIGTGATLTVVSNGAGLATVGQSNATAGSYVYTLLSVSDASNTACSNPQTGTATVKVNPLPTATINGTTEVCASSANSTITFQGNGGTAPYTFSYQIGTGATLTVVSNGAGLATVSQSNATAGSYVYTLFSVSDASNTACSNPQTGSATVKVNPLPTATINGTTEVCASSANSTITFQGNGGTAPYTFSYKIGTGASLTVVSNGAGLATVSQSNATAGSYVYTLLSVSDASNTACSNPQTGTVTVKVNPLPTATINGTTEVCASSANSTITFQGNGGTAPYTFSYKIGTGATLTVVSNGAGLATVSQSNAIAGSYVYTLLSVNDATNTACSNPQSGTVTVKVNPLPTATIDGTTEVCTSSANSTITFQGNGGTAPYTFSYKIGTGATLTVVSDGAGLATVSQSNATAGSYVYTLLSVSDASNTACSNAQTGTATVKVNPLPTATIDGTTEVCVSSANSTITFQGNGGTAPYTFSYKIGTGATLTVVSNGAGLATVSQSNATAGNYVYTLLSVSDATNTACSNPQSGTVTVKVNPLPTATINGTTEVCVSSANSTITFQGNGGTAPYTFSYKIGTGAALTVVSNGAGLATVSQSNATAGSYVYTLLSVSDASNTACSNAQTGTATVKVNPLPTATINGTTEVCASSANSTITFQGNGGTAPYTFSYKIGTGAALTVVSNGAGLATVSQSNATAGNYVYTLLSVSDASNTACSNAQTGSATVKVNPLPTAAITGTTEVCASSANSTITFQGNGGTAPYTFSYKIGNGAALTVVSNGAGLATVSQSNATAGSYVYTLLSVSDASNTACSNAQTGTATVKVNPLPTATINGTTEVCASSANSTITFQGNGGTAPYTFSYKIGTGAALTVVSNGAGLATVSQSNATAGSYVYTLLSVADASNTACSNAQTGSATVKVNPLPTATINGTTEVCASSANSTITFLGNGGTAPYTFSYKIGNGAALTVVSNGAGLATVSQSNATAGSYIYTLLTVSDASNTACSNAQTGSATVKVNPLPTATINGTTEVCASSANSTITFQGNGGTAPYTFSYKIGTGAALTVVSNGAGLATVNQSNATAGSYVYTLLSVSDATNTACSNAQTGTATVKVNPLPTATINGTTEICASSTNSTITFRAANGTAPYIFTYKLNNGSAQTIQSNVSGTATITQSNAIAGNYVYTLISVNDASLTACSNPQSGSATIKVNPLPTAIITGNIEVCASSANSPITFRGNSGTAPYIFTYKLNNGVAQTISSDASGVATINQLNSTAGTYVYTLISVSDATLTACGNAQTGTATVKVNPLPTATISGNTEVCVSTASSIITFRGANGTAPYTFSYKVGAGDVQTVISNGAGVATVSKTNSVAGIYAYTLLSVNDASHTACSNPQGGIATVIVNPNTTIQLSSAAATTAQTVCINNPVRSITYQTTNATSVTATGLPAGVTGTYLNGVFTITGSPSVTGTFNYTVTAVGNCTTVQSTGTITVNPKPVGFNDEITSLSCGNTAISYNLQDNVNNTAKGGNAVPSTFSWTALTNSNVIGIASGSGARINATLYNLSNVVQQVTYTVTPTSTLGTCPGTPFTVKVNVPVCSGITITKTADVSVVTQAGDPVKYTITVKNTATANQTRVKVTDPFLGGVLAAPVSGDNGNGILEANESWIYTGIYRVSQSDIDNFGKPNAGTGKIINTATVSTAERPGLLSASATVDIVTTGEIALVKTGVLSSDFSTITYTFRITNTGKVRLSNLNLVDTKIRGAITVNPTVLEAGASVTATAVYTITDAEKRDGQVLNTATVTATSPSGSPVRDVSGTQSNNDDPTLHIIEDAPQALNDNSETKINQPVIVNLADNDLPSFNGLDKGSIVITKFPANGEVHVNADGTIVYTPNRGYSGPDEFIYKINDLKGKVSNVALVNITVTPIDLFIPNTFTPNGDGKNDTFKIIGRESFDSINFLIFNRWGNEVYRNMNYLDEWDGSGLSEATYYYIIVLKKGANEVTRKGWILLKR